MDTCINGRASGLYLLMTSAKPIASSIPGIANARSCIIPPIPDASFSAAEREGRVASRVSLGASLDQGPGRALPGSVATQPCDRPARPSQTTHPHRHTPTRGPPHWSRIDGRTALDHFLHVGCGVDLHCGEIVEPVDLSRLLAKLLAERVRQVVRRVGRAARQSNKHSAVIQSGSCGPRVGRRFGLT